MIYARVSNGSVDRVVNTGRETFVFFYRRVFKTFSLWLRVDELPEVPEVGWLYSDEDGFTEH